MTNNRYHDCSLLSVLLMKVYEFLKGITTRNVAEMETRFKLYLLKTKNISSSSKYLLARTIGPAMRDARQSLRTSPHRNLLHRDYDVNSELHLDTRSKQTVSLI